MNPSEPSFRSTFPTTEWSLIARGKEAIAELVQRYQGALRSHLMWRRGVSRHEADDLIQGMITSQMLESDLLERADQTKGRFRTFLLTALDRYVAKQHRRENAKMRSPGKGRVKSIDAADSAAVAAPESDSFEIAWARQVLNDAVTRMRAHCSATHQEPMWEVFQGRILRPILEHLAPMSYDELWRTLGLASPSQAFNLLATGKRTYIRMLRGVIAETVCSEDEIDDEIHDLIRILSGSGAESVGA